MLRQRAFTLVELVVVVLILGILAAVAAPKILYESDDATNNGVRQTLTVIRDAIDMYFANSGGIYPGADGVENTFKADLDPYLQGTSFPSCPVGPVQDNSVLIVGTSVPLFGVADPPKAWKYSTATGQFIVNCNRPTTTDASVNYDRL